MTKQYFPFVNDILEYFSLVKNRSHIIHIKNKLYWERFGEEKDRTRVKAKN